MEIASDVNSECTQGMAVIGLIFICISILGFRMAYEIKRSTVFRLKLALVFISPLLLALTKLTNTDVAVSYEAILIGLFSFSLMVLYWRELKLVGAVRVRKRF